MKNSITRSVRSRVVGFATAVVVVCATDVAAAARIPLDDELIAASDGVIVGQVLASSARRDGRGDIRTDTTIEVERVPRGPFRPGDKIVVTEIGGDLGSVSLIVPGSVEFVVGERCLLFLRKEAGEWRVVAREAGKVSISHNHRVDGTFGGSTRELDRFVSYITAVSNGHPGMPYARKGGVRHVRPEVVPSRYTVSSKRTSDDNGPVHPLRWQTFATLTFGYRGSQSGAANGGLTAFQNALNAWLNDANSNITMSAGNATSAGAVQDGQSTIQFDDPDGVIPGAYSRPAVAATTGSMAVARRDHSAVFLGAGGGNKVLIAGGTSGTGALNSAYLYNPATQTFSATTNTMSTARKSFVEVLLDDGTVLLAGGHNGSSAVDQADLFDPFSSSFSAIPENGTGHVMNAARFDAVAAMTGTVNARHVVIAGGSNGTSALNTAEAYDPDSATFTSIVATMTSVRQQAAAALLSDGRSVLIAGGSNGSAPLASSEIYAPGSALNNGTFTAAGTLNVARIGATATLLTDGSVLVTGGTGVSGALSSAERFNPTTGQFSVVGSMSSPRSGHTATLLANGRVLIVGGSNGSSPLSSIEIYDPDTRQFTALTVALSTQRSLHTATRLSDGKVLVAGGTNGTNALATADLFSSPPSFDLGIVKLWSDNSTYTFGGVTFQRVTEADIVVQNGFTGAGLTNGGLDQLLANLAGQALAFATAFEPAVMNSSFDIDAPPFGANLQPYDREAAGYIYPLCPAITVPPQSVNIRSGQSTTLAVNASGGGDLVYQWYEDAAGGPVAVGTNASQFTTPPLTSTTRYFVRITNDCASMDSAIATVTVYPRGDANGDGAVTSADLPSFGNFLFATGAAPLGDPDANSDSATNALDLFYLANYISGGGPAPAP